jgi:hypothetical protein
MQLRHNRKPCLAVIALAAAAQPALAVDYIKQIGSINNNGLVRVFAGSTDIAAAATIGGVWVMDAGRLTFSGTHAVISFTMNDGTTARRPAMAR